MVLILLVRSACLVWVLMIVFLYLLVGWNLMVVRLGFKFVVLLVVYCLSWFWISVLIVMLFVMVCWCIACWVGGLLVFCVGLIRFCLFVRYLIICMLMLLLCFSFIWFDDCLLVFVGVYCCCLLSVFVWTDGFALLVIVCAIVWTMMCYLLVAVWGGFTLFDRLWGLLWVWFGFLSTVIILFWFMVVLLGFVDCIFTLGLGWWFWFLGWFYDFLVLVLLLLILLVIVECLFVAIIAMFALLFSRHLDVYYVQI